MTTMKDDMISRQAALNCVYGTSPNKIKGRIAELPSATDTNVGDMISRQGVLRLLNAVPSEEFATKAMLIRGVNALPSAQPNLSEAYSKAVFTWLMDYQIRAAELKGRYTPYEVLSWVINDWRKENE